MELQLQQQESEEFDHKYMRKLFYFRLSRIMPKLQDELKEDVVQEALLIQYLHHKETGKYRDVGHVVLDAIRKTLGDTRLKKNSGILVPFEDLPLEDLPRTAAVSEQDKRDLHEFILFQYEPGSLGKIAAKLVLHGLYLYEVAQIFNLSEGRISQILKTHLKKKRFRH